MGRSIWITTSAVALLWCGAAQAQQAAPAPQDNEATTLGEVVVTAERRTTNLQETPIAASVFSGEQLQNKGVTNIETLQFAMPSVTVQNSGQGNSFNIRGIGKTENSSSIGVGVITYRDGVAVFPAYFQNEPFYDIASLELLRGPQGTFAGQNATGGAVFITERNPDLTGVNGYVTGQYGSYDHLRLQGAVNVPLGDTVALRLAGNIEQRDSFYEVIQGAPTVGDPGVVNIESYRASLLWQPTDALRILWKNDYSHIDLGGYPTTPVGSPDSLFDIRTNGPFRGIDETVRSVLNINYEFDNGMVLRSITGYQDGTTSVRADTDGTATLPFTSNIKVDQRLWSQEFNLISPDEGPLRWVVGAYYQDDLITFPPGQFTTTQYLSPTLPLLVALTLQGENPKTTAAAFGQVSYDFTDSLELQVGARFSRSTVENHAVSAIPALGLSISQNDKVEEDKLTGKVALNYTLDDNNFLYGFVATGYKAGGLNGPNILGVPPGPFDGEEVLDFEAGWKATAFDGRLRTQIGGYYNIYENFQVIIGDPTTPTITTISNVPGETKIYGLEATAQGRFDALGFDIGLSLAHSELGDFYAIDPRGTLTGGCNAATGPASATCTNVGGNAQTYAPELTFNFGVEYDFAVGGGRLTPRVDYSHISETWTTIFANEARGDRLEARDIVNALLTYEPGNGDWVLQAYGTNVFDEEYVGSVKSGQRYAGPPRQYGIRITRNF
ncbi:TonB-dependent receptor [Brevundimonas lenta]|uniref:Iron complex outermembrane receptor protein n=1 Tax=Brevundimonas lenta TaxID=424796 RepID=A0A7W6NNP7_9CAUL|nr:TonB-dependent receptor [Brevundimonas lenta]MBB4081993.1 iron complex outermembrane receptor protein [Brevundimonas lenta]